MNTKEYVNKVCSKCKNKLNDKDLCNIRKTMSGNYRCENEAVDEIYIHYGHKHFDINLFKEIKNVGFVKPDGGLWAASINAEDSWKKWTEENAFMTDKYRDDNYFKFKLKENAKILTITNRNQLKDLPKEEHLMSHSYYILDFEKLSKKYDAIEVILSANYGGLYWDLYGWDVDSLLVLNKEVVEEIM